MADHRPNRYIESGRVIYRASALGSCIKSLVALGLGITPSDHPDWLLTKFQQGIDDEPVVLDMLRPNWVIMDEQTGHYYEWDDGQLYVQVNVGTRVVIRGHADGIATCYKAPVYDTDWKVRDKRVVEVKCVTEDYGHTIIQKLPPMYAWQVSVYGGFYQLPVMLALGIKDDTGTVVNVVTEMIDELPYTMGQVKARVMYAEQCIESGELPNCDAKMWPCPFAWLCDDVVDGPNNPRTGDGELLGKLEESVATVRVRSQG